MSPETLYDHFAEKTKEEHYRLVSLITENIAVEKIFLLGQTVLQRKTETLFTKTTASVMFTAHYFLAVLVKNEDEYTLCCLQDKIESNLQHFIPATAIVICIDAFNNWLKEGNPFASIVTKKGIKLYDNGVTELNLSAGINEEEQQKKNESLFKQTIQRAESFLAAAKLLKSRQDYKLSAFMLHQCAEQCLRTMLIINSGLRINSHNIDRLSRYCSMSCERVNDLFPVIDEKMKKLHSLLSKAYIDARYKHEYNISYEELVALTEKVKTIKALLEHYSPCLHPEILKDSELQNEN